MVPLILVYRLVSPMQRVTRKFLFHFQYSMSECILYRSGNIFTADVEFGGYTITKQAYSTSLPPPPPFPSNTPPSQRNRRRQPPRRRPRRSRALHLLRRPRNPQLSSRRPSPKPYLRPKHLHIKLHVFHPLALF